MVFPRNDARLANYIMTNDFPVRMNDFWLDIYFLALRSDLPDPIWTPRNHFLEAENRSRKDDPKPLFPARLDPSKSLRKSVFVARFGVFARPLQPFGLERAGGNPEKRAKTLFRKLLDGSSRAGKSGFGSSFRDQKWGSSGLQKVVPGCPNRVGKVGSERQKVDIGTSNPDTTDL